MQLDALEKSEEMYKKGEEKMRKSRNFFKAQSESFKKMGLVDELTGLYNRRGFTMLAEQQFKVAKRKDEEMFLIVSDLDHLKLINDKFGHAKGDRALADAARILRSTFRNSDVVARIGGDEFAVVLGTGTGETPKNSMERLRKNFEKHNQNRRDPYLLELSSGTASYQPNDPLSLNRVIDRADKVMYEEKREKYSKIRDFV
jgi:diguanylate cyclase (GGDEF)-like protein